MCDGLKSVIIGQRAAKTLKLSNLFIFALKQYKMIKEVIRNVERHRRKKEFLCICPH